jgi:hypothetical protein
LVLLLCGVGFGGAAINDTRGGGASVAPRSEQKTSFGFGLLAIGFVDFDVIQDLLTTVNGADDLDKKFHGSRPFFALAITQTNEIRSD